MVDYLSKLLKGASIIFIASIFSSLFGYFIRVILARKLTTDDFGLFFAVYNIILLIGWIRGFGLQSAIGKYIPQYLVENNNDKIKSILIFVTTFTLFSTFIFFAVAYIIPVQLITTYFHSEAARGILLILFAYVFIDSVSSIITGYFLSVYWFILYSLRDAMTRAIILVLLFLVSDVSIMQVAYIYVFASFVNMVTNIFYFFKIFPFFHYKTDLSIKNSKELFSFGFPLMIRDFFGVLMSKVDNIIIVYFRPLWEVGLYNVVVPTADMLLIFSRPFGRIMFPLSSELYTLDQKEKINSLLQKIHKHLLILVIPCSITLFLFSKYLLGLVFGIEYEKGYPGLMVLAFGFIFNSLSIVNYSVLLGIGKQKVAAAVTIIANILNAVLTLALVYYMGRLDLGYLGAIIGTVVSSIVLFFLISYYLQKNLGYLFSRRLLLFLSVISVLILGMGYLIKLLIINNHVELGLFLVVLGITYPLLLLAFKLTSISEVKSLTQMLFKKKELENGEHQS